MTSQNIQSSSPATHTETRIRAAITPELVREVSRKVWLMFQTELQIENERQRFPRQPFNHQGGS